MPSAAVTISSLFFCVLRKVGDRKVKVSELALKRRQHLPDFVHL